MNLVVDVGNTETVVGLAPDPRRIAKSWRISTGVPRTADEMTVLMRVLLDAEGTTCDDLQDGVVGSVVPSVTRVWIETLGSLVPGRVFQVRPDTRLPIVLAVDEPRTVGADRIANTLATKIRYGCDSIAVDLGTATTFDCITAEGVFLGGVIAPGLNAGLDWLSDRAAKLPSVDFGVPGPVVGKRTEDCIRSGVFYSAIASIDGVVRLIKMEWEKPAALVVVTGGLASLVTPHLSEKVVHDPSLTLCGLALAGDMLRKE